MSKFSSAVLQSFNSLIFYVFGNEKSPRSGEHFSKVNFYIYVKYFLAENVYIIMYRTQNINGAAKPTTKPTDEPTAKQRLDIFSFKHFTYVPGPGKIFTYNFPSKIHLCTDFLEI